MTRLAGRTRDRAMVEQIDERIDALVRAGQFFAALGLACAEQRQRGESFETLSRVARIETLLGLLQRAKRSWQRAGHFRDDAAVHAGLGAVLFRQGEARAAVDAFLRSLELAPENLPALTSLAVAHAHLGDFTMARRYASRVLLAEPDNGDALLSRARADLALGNPHAAKSDIARLAASRHNQDEVKLLEVELHRQLDDFETALFLAAELCDRHPASEECLATFRQVFRDFRVRADADIFAEFLQGLALPWARLDPPPRKAPDADDCQKIDVIVPVHDALDQVEDCISAVLANSGARLGRLILVNDASTDQTVARLSAISQMADEVVLLHTAQHSGFTAAVMLGLGHSTSEEFVVLNSDAYVPPGWLNRLHGALRSDPAAAAVGPLSNAAAWQSYAEVFDKAGAFASSEIPLSPLRADLLAAADASPIADMVPLPMLHGFCVLFDRGAFDSVGGFDLQAFPEGYGETQDLSFRLRAAGHNLYAVTDCVVFHERGASLSTSRRAALSRAARATLYARHSALCYLTSEMVCCDNPTMDAGRKRYARALAVWL